MQIPNQEIFCQMGAVSADGYFVFEVHKALLTYFNPAFCWIFGLEVADIVHTPKRIMERIHPEDSEHVIFCYEELLENGKEKKYVFRLGAAGNEKVLKASLVLSDDRIVAWPHRCRLCPFQTVSAIPLLSHRI